MDERSIWIKPRVKPPLVIRELEVLREAEGVEKREAGDDGKDDEKK
jgi:hypothetical protein